MEFVNVDPLLLNPPSLVGIIMGSIILSPLKRRGGGVIHN